MKSLSNTDTTHRTLQMIEVIYFCKKEYHDRKHLFFTKAEAEQMYQRTINKYSGDSQQVMVVLADENQATQKSWRNF